MSTFARFHPVGRQYAVAGVPPNAFTISPLQLLLKLARERETMRCRVCSATLSIIHRLRAGVTDL